jgi:hypothetical protein
VHDNKEQLLIVYFTSCDDSDRPRTLHVGNSKYGLGDLFRSLPRYSWSLIGKNQIRVGINPVLPSDAGTFKCEDKLVLKSASVQVSASTRVIVIGKFTLNKEINRLFISDTPYTHNERQCKNKYMKKESNALLAHLD